MFCPNCGTKLEDDAVFCTSCGVQLNKDQGSAPQPAAQPEAVSEQTVENTWQEAPQQNANQDVWQQAEPGAQAEGQTQPPADVVAPPDYMTINIILTVVSVFACCFSCIGVIGIITGIIGIVSASGVRSAMSAHNYALAEQKSKTAKNMWIVTAVILGVSVFFGILFAVMGMSSYILEEFL